MKKPPRDPEESARLAGLLHTTDQTPGYARLAAGKRFRYVDASGKAIRDRAELDPIRSLVIPPAWTKVWICPDAAGHLQAVGFDARGRKQYRYHQAYRSLRNLTKHLARWSSGLREKAA